MTVVRANSSEPLAILLVILVGALFIPNIRVSYFQTGGSDPRFTAQAGTQPDFLMQIEPNQFLMRNSTTANPGIAFTPLNGFIGKVTLSAIVSPVEHSAPTVSFNSSTVSLNASLPGSTLYPILVTTNMTESGLYTITITGSSASMTHSASATVGVTSVFVPANGADLVYKARFTEAVYAGGSTVLNNSLLNLGYAPIGIMNLTVSLSFGTYLYHPTCTPPQNPCITFSPFLSLNPYDEKSITLTIQIPDNTSAGNYTVTAIVSWVLNPWTLNPRSGPDLIAHGYLIVHSNPPNLPPQLPQSLPSPSNTPSILNGLFGFMVLGGVIAILVVRLTVPKSREKPSTFERLPIKTPFCAHCGTPAAFGIKFCAQCGHQIP